MAFPEYSRVALQRAFDAGHVKVNDVVVTRDHTARPGDHIAFEFPEVRPAELKPVDIPLDVLFEDKHLLAVNKPAGMVVHPGAGTTEDTLVHALLSHCHGSLSGIGGVERPGIVHRLDRETSGLIIIAKSDAAHRGLSSQFSERTLQKEYLTLVQGVPSLLSGSIRKPIGRNLQHRHKMAVVETESGGRDAHTDWQVEEVFGRQAALIRCTIHTGRTHQIRVHMKSLGHVILGDDVYGWKPDASLSVNPVRVMLHAEHLVVKHPITGKTLDLRAPLPRDFQQVLTALRPPKPAVKARVRRVKSAPPKPSKSVKKSSPRSASTSKSRSKRKSALRT
ncbi:MAG: RluA family pseudouridine synthase [Opitutaceae bacterium]|nr:RluA family pseudouridine synthase [Opitutaceae bacterium]